MQGRNVIIVSVLLLPLISCSKIEKTNGQVEVVQLTEESLPPVQPLKLEKMDISEDYSMGASCFVYQDSVLLVLKDGDPYPLKYMLTLVNMNTGEKIGEYFTRGKGPGELLSALGRLTHNYLDICCYTTRKLVAFNIDSAIMLGNGYCPKIVDAQGILINEWASVNDTSFLLSNSFYADSKISKPNSLLPEFYTVNIGGSTSPKYDLKDYKDIRYLTSDVYTQTISINKEKKRMICCYMCQPCIKIFDKDLNVIKKIEGPEPDDVKYAPKDGYMFFMDGDGVTHYYTAAFCDNENIFVTNRRNRKCTEMQNYAEIENEKREIFRLDWEGNVIARYNAKGKNVVRVSYSKNSNTLYLWVYDEDRAMYKAKLD